MHCASKVSSFQRLPGRRIANIEYMHCAGKVSSVQRLPDRRMASNLSTCTALARLAPFSGFLADALQAIEHMHCAGKVSAFQRLPNRRLQAICVQALIQRFPDRRIASNSGTCIALARLVLPQLPGRRMASSFSIGFPADRSCLLSSPPCWGLGQVGREQGSGAYGTEDAATLLCGNRIPCRPLVPAELPSVLGSRAGRAGAGSAHVLRWQG
jgi:hypothetical protein